MDHILGHKTNVNKYRKIKLALYNLSDKNAIKFEINK